MKRLLVLIASLIAATVSAAPNPDDYVRYLVPVIQRDLRGANDSLWTTELMFRNRWGSAMTIIAPVCGPLTDPCVGNSLSIDPSTTTTIQLFPRGDGTDGAFLYVPKSLNDPKPAITLRVRDKSKNATGFGAEIHMPQLDEYQHDIDLIDIPTDARYRATLRIYGASEAPQTVRVRTFTEDGKTPIDEQVVTLSGILTIVFDPFPLHPAYLQLDPLTATARASGDRLRITVDVMGENVSPPPPPVWAFVTITDNVTQLTSTITPNR
ncbi:MAG: hypothetical protein ACXV7D_12570 [Thermoanaerobaculia bacterium]